MVWKGFVRKRLCPNLRYYFGFFPEALKKSMEILNKHSYSAERELNPGPHEYESGVLTILGQHPTHCFFTDWNKQVSVTISPKYALLCPERFWRSFPTLYNTPLIWSNVFQMIMHSTQTPMQTSTLIMTSEFFTISWFLLLPGTEDMLVCPQILP